MCSWVQKALLSPETRPEYVGPIGLRWIQSLQKASIWKMNSSMLLRAKWTKIEICQPYHTQRILLCWHCQQQRRWKKLTWSKLTGWFSLKSCFYQWYRCTARKCSYSTLLIKCLKHESKVVPWVSGEMETKVDVLEQRLGKVKEKWLRYRWFCRPAIKWKCIS